MIPICIIVISTSIRDLRVGLVIEVDLNLFLWWMKMKMMILVAPVVMPKQLKLIPALIDHRKFHLRRLRRRNRWLRELLIIVHPKKWWPRKKSPAPRVLRLILL